MSNYTQIRVRVPDIPTPFKSGNTDYSKENTKKANADMIRRINAEYGSIITRWGTLFNIPNGVLIGFIATESGGRMLPANVYKATGLMQVTPNAIWECARKWQSTVGTPLPPQALAELNKKTPEILSSKSSTPTAAQANKIIGFLQRDANYNIMAGTLTLRWLLERFSTIQTGGQLNKAMVAYNAGAYIRVLNESATKPIKTPIDSTTLATNRQVPAESRAYLFKMLGKDGFLSLIFKDRVI